MSLSACQSAEDRAEEHYQRALSLMEAGDFDRARVEFLNVFSNDGFHREARSELAAMYRRRGDLNDSYSQYLRLVEQYPDDLEGRIALAEMALQFQNWDEAERHGARAIESAPEEFRTQIIAVYLNYLETLEAEDDPARRDVFDQVAELSDTEPDNLLLRRLTIDHLLREGDFESALSRISQAIEAEPDDRSLYDLRLSILVQLGREEEIETHLLTMRERFPDDTELPSMLLNYYLALGQTDQAAAFLRAEAAAATDPDLWQEALVALVQLLAQVEGQEAALEELDRIVQREDVSAPAIFNILRASIRFDLGETDAAIADLEALLETDLSVIETGQVRVSMAQMLLATGNAVGARAQVEQTLEDDPAQVDALKMLAAWMIDEDEANRAIGHLRTALDLDADDPQALTLMADAHSRNGDHNLAREFYALAVEASNSAPAETLRYVPLLMEDDQLFAAEELLIDALQQRSADRDLLAMLGDLYIRQEDWSRAEQVERRLRELGDEQAERVAASLQSTRLAAQGRVDEAVGFLEGLAAASGLGDVGAQVAVIRARIASGDLEGALTFAERLVEEAPDNLAYRFALAATQNALGNAGAAEALFLDLTQREPTSQQAWIGLIRSLSSQGKIDAAEAALQDALTVLPEALDLLWAQASFREQAGDFEGAIEIYELMYERVPSSEVVANNLASLLSTYRDDDASLERAWTVARRLRGLEVAPFQDTYGWLAYRQGDFDEALEHLEPAAAGLPTDPLVQFHLGMTYAALGRLEDAQAQLQRAVEIAGPDDTRAQFETARREIIRIEGELQAVSE
ncbi:MAG: tetratricopeptide repeat protein [Pseudomonadota bacterium]